MSRKNYLFAGLFNLFLFKVWKTFKKHTVDFTFNNKIRWWSSILPDSEKQVLK